MLACDCQGPLGIGLEFEQRTLAVVGGRQHALAALIVRRRVLEFVKWDFLGHRDFRAIDAPASSAS
jgi:hypothetical protein